MCYFRIIVHGCILVNRESSVVDTKVVKEAPYESETEVDEVVGKVIRGGGII